MNLGGRLISCRAVGKRQRIEVGLDDGWTQERGTG
jgi:hypothetical protein